MSGVQSLFGNQVACTPPISSSASYRSRTIFSTGASLTSITSPSTEASRLHPWKLYYSIRNRLLTVYRYLPWRYVPTHVGVWLFLYGWQALRLSAPGTYGRGVWAGLTATRRFHRHPIKPETVAYLKAHGGRLWY